MSASDALRNYSQKLLNQQTRRQKRPAGKKNQKPEKYLEGLVLKWAQGRGLDLHVVESKAVYSASAGRYLRGQTEAGMPDLIGNYQGLSVWIELKAPGRRGTLKAHQFEFLVAKAKAGCFACCTDSVYHVESLFKSFLDADDKSRVSMLLSDLPKPKCFDADDEDLF